MTKIKFYDEHFAMQKWERGVYKMIINEQWFYIGSSVDLKRRLGGWKHHILNGYPKNANVKYLLPIMETVRFEIIERVGDDIDPKTREAEYIKQNLDNFDCLNMCPGAFDPTGRKVAFGQGVRYKRKYPKTPAKKVGQFSKDGKLIKVHDSLGLASFFITGTRKGVEDISRVARGLSKYYLGFIFKFVNTDGSFIEPPKFVKKKPASINRKYTDKKAILKVNSVGEVVDRYENLTDMNKKTGIDKRKIWRVLAGKRKSTGGFIYAYADQYTQQQTLMVF